MASAARITTVISHPTSAVLAVAAVEGAGSFTISDPSVITSSIIDPLVAVETSNGSIIDSTTGFSTEFFTITDSQLISSKSSLHAADSSSTILSLASSTATSTPLPLSSPSYSPPQNPPSSASLSAGAKIGLGEAIAVVMLCLLVGGILGYRRRRIRRRTHRTTKQSTVPEMGGSSRRNIPELEGAPVERTTGRAELESSAVLDNDKEREEFRIAQG